MKKILLYATMIVIANEVTAHRIHLSKDTTSNSVKVSCDDFLQSIKVGERVNLGNFAIGHWNGTSFFVSPSATLPTEKVEISSNVPVTFESFLSEKCDIQAPGVRIMGETKINDFVIKLIESTKNALDIVGTLITKCVDMVGSIVISGRLVSPDELKVDTTKSFMATVTNNGGISSGSGVISFATKDFINDKYGQIFGDKAFFLINGQFQNSGILEFNQFSLNLMSEMIAVAETGFNPIRFIQMGNYTIHNQASLACNFESFGRTQINHLIFPYPSKLVISNGQAMIGAISGKMSLIQTKDRAKAMIGEVKMM